MKRLIFSVLFVTLVAVGGTPVLGQVFKYFSPGSTWTVTMVKVAAGMDQAYMEYLSTQFKKAEDAQVKAGVQKSYKVLRTVENAGDWNLLILREYNSLAAYEAEEERRDTVRRQSEGSDQDAMKGYEDRSRIRELVGTKIAREVILK